MRLLIAPPAIARWAAKRDIEAHLVGVDLNPRSAEIARGIRMPIQIYPIFDIALRAALGMHDDTTGIEAIYQRAGTTSVDAIADVVGSLDPVSLLLRGGLTDADMDRARRRLMA